LFANNQYTDYEDTHALDKMGKKLLAKWWEVPPRNGGRINRNRWLQSEDAVRTAHDGQAQMIDSSRRDRQIEKDDTVVLTGETTW
jgi:hypothetical protein